MPRYCVKCGKELPSSRWVYCSKECKSALKAEQYRSLNPIRGKTTGTTGAISELRVAIDLLHKGFDVFRSMSPNAPADLIILKDGRPFLIEVRTAHILQSGKYWARSKKPDDKPDIYAFVLPDEIVYEPELPKK